MRFIQQTLTAAYLVFGILVEAGWVDPDTPIERRTMKSLIDGTTYNLVSFNIHQTM